MSDFIEGLIQDRIDRGKGVPGDFRGCTDEEIARLESRIRIELPALFKDYLRKMGWSAGEMLRGSDIRFGCLHELTEEARAEMRARNFDLPDDAFVFFAHQGYDYMYFPTSEGSADPKVYRFHLMQWEEPRQVFHTFSDYLTWMFAASAGIPPDGLRDD